MGSLIMDSEDLRSAGSRIKGYGDTFVNLVSQFYSYVDAITASDVWSGEADSVSFKSVADGMKGDLQSASEIITEVGTNFEGTANSYDATVESNSNRINSVV